MSTQRKSKTKSQSANGSFTKSVLDAVKNIGVSESTKQASPTLIHVKPINPSTSSSSKASIVNKRKTSRKIPRRVKPTSSKSSSIKLNSILTKFGLENVSRKPSEKQSTIDTNLPLSINEKPLINLFKINSILLELVNRFIPIFIIKCDIQNSEPLQMPFYYLTNSNYKKCGGSDGKCINILGINRGTQGETLTPIFSKFSNAHTGFIQYKQRFIKINYNPFFKVLNILNIIFHNELFNDEISDDNIEAKLNEFKNTNISSELKKTEYNDETHLNIIITNIINIYINIYNCICSLPAALFNFDVNLNNTFTNSTCANARLSIIMVQILTRLGSILAEISSQINKLNTNALLNKDKLSKILNLCKSTINLLQISSYGTKYDFYRLTDMCSNFNKIDECNRIQLKGGHYLKNTQKGGDQQCNSISSDIISFDIPETDNIKKINTLLQAFVKFAKFKNDFDNLFLPKIKTEDDLNNKDNIENFIDIVDAITFIRTYTADFMTEYGQYSTSEAIKQKTQANEKYRKKPLTNKVKLRIRSFLNKLTRKKKYDLTTSSINKSADNKLSKFTESETKYNLILYTEVLPKVYGLCGKYVSNIDTNISAIKRKLTKLNKTTIPYQMQTQLLSTLIKELEDLKGRYSRIYNNLPTHKLEKNENIISSTDIPDIRENIKTFIELVDLGYMLYLLSEKSKGESRRKIGVNLSRNTTSAETTV